VGSGANVTGKLLAGTGPTGAVTMAGAGGNTLGGCSIAPGVVCTAITLNPPTLQDGTVGIAYNATIVASGGTGPYTYLVTTGTLPAGLLLNNATGAITGIPTTNGTSGFTITATDTFNGCTVSDDYSLIVGAAVPVIPVAVPVLDYVGLAVLFMLLAGAGVFVMSRF
ncbi:MAG: Ig domain-containing protein, partial [Thermoanaerobaculia bacterium]